MAELRIAERLRERRVAQHLNQTELARKLGIRQSQISDLERGVVDPRLSTVRDVARVLDSELMLIPRQLLPVVQGLVRAKGAPTKNRPLYALDGDDEDESGGAPNSTSEHLDGRQNREMSTRDAFC